MQGTVSVWIVVAHFQNDATAINRLYPRVFAGLNNPRDGAAVDVLLRLGEQVRRVGIPLVVTDTAGRVTAAANLPFDAAPDDPRVRPFAAELDRENPPITEPSLGTLHYGLADGRLAMYYVGFELCHHVRYCLLTGVAVSDDDGDSFRRLSAAAILERSDGERHIRGGPFVLFEGDRYRMWYVAGSRWETVNGKSMPIYDVRHIESHDCLHRPSQGQVVVPLDLAREHGIGRPFVLRRDEGFRMHYSIRRRSPLRYERTGAFRRRVDLATRRRSHRSAGEPGRVGR